MRILVTNDDGINAPGLKALEKIAHELAGDTGEVWVIAPTQERDQVLLGELVLFPDPDDTLVVDLDGRVIPISIHQHVLVRAGLKRTPAPVIELTLFVGQASDDLEIPPSKVTLGTQLEVRGSPVAVLPNLRPRLLPFSPSMDGTAVRTRESLRRVWEGPNIDGRSTPQARLLATRHNLSSGATALGELDLLAGHRATEEGQSLSVEELDTQPATPVDL